ncbi:ketopantoate reductase family protein [Pseudonocardia sp. GCM10023141]|uniref:ketopantoate reductase family protein n=1 Tax=Pseudonocardia sp. GCM10023141 TaxID=3252653 RepID=UPI003610B208
MDYWLVGAGGIGCSIGGPLALRRDVLIVDRWADHVRAINEGGLRVSFPGGDIHVRTPALTWDELGDDVAVPSAVLLAVKSIETRQACAMLAAVLPPGVPVVSLQNGLNEETISDILGPERTIGAVCVFGGSVVAPGHTRSTSRSGELIIGELDGRMSDRLRRLRQDLSRSVEVTVVENIWGQLWSKLILNTMINAISGVTSLSMAAFAERPVALALAVAVGAEGIRVAGAADVQVDADYLLGYSTDDFLEPIGSPTRRRIEASFREYYLRYPTAMPSMWQDVMTGRRSEIDEINGYVAQVGDRVGVPTPLNDALVAWMREVDGGSRTPDPTVVDKEFAELMESVHGYPTYA